MDYPKELKYTKEHEWVRLDGGEATVGISDYAQDALGDIVYVELPKQGDKLEKSKGAAVVESVKSASDVYAPISGEVTEVNGELESNPELVNKSPYGDGWMYKMKVADPKELDELMSNTEYEKLIEGKG